MSDSTQSIIDAAATPKTVQTEHGRVEQHSLAEQMVARKTIPDEPNEYGLEMRKIGD